MLSGLVWAINRTLDIGHVERVKDIAPELPKLSPEFPVV
jgi:hypothetical protein